MPTKRAVLEKLKFELHEHPENGDQKAFYADVEADQKERIKNNRRKQNFVLVTGDPDLCAEFEAQKDRIFRKVQNKTLMLELMIRAWRDALADPQLDKILAVMEVEEHGPE